MAAKIYDKIPIVDTARRCGLVLDSRTLRRKEVEASCPFCGDHGPGKYHLSLNTDTDQYRCNLCGAHGNSVSLYARIKGICNKEAYATTVQSFSGICFNRHAQAFRQAFAFSDSGHFTNIPSSI